MAQQRQMQQQQGPLPKILRIGVVIAGKIVEEKLIRSRDTVTIGQSAKNTFAIPAAELPKTFPVFQMTPQGYVLNFFDAMDGRISDGDNIYPLLQMKQGQARRVGNHYSLPLGERARGKITVGDMTLLFQFVTPPPLAAKPQLPHSVRGTIGDRIDPYLAACVLFSAVLHISFVAYAWTREKKRPPDISLVSAEDAERWAKLPPPPPPEPEPIATDVKPVEGTGTVVGPVAKGGGGDNTPKQPKGPDTGGGDESPGERENRVNQAIASNKFLQTLGYRTASGQGQVYDYGAGRDPGTDIDKSLATGGKVVGSGTPGGPLGGSRGGNETGKTADGKGINIGGGPGDSVGNTQPGGKTEKVVKGEVKGGNADVDDPDAVPAASIAAKIRSAYMGGVRACYERGLKQDPDMAGRVEIEFTIGPLGTVQKASIADSELNNSTVETCIKTAAKAWSFNKPKSGEPVTVQYPFVFKASSK